MTSVLPRGRPRSVSDDQILDAALRAFATFGFEATSLRSLNEELGLSHQAISQRFGSKASLFVAAVDHGLRSFFEETRRFLEAEAAPSDDLAELRSMLGAFVHAARRHPELGRLINHEGLHESERLDHLIGGIGPSFALVAERLESFASNRTIRPTSVREFFFLSQAAAAPFNLGPLSRAFDQFDGPLEPDDYVESVIDIILRGLLL